MQSFQLHKGAPGAADEIERANDRPIKLARAFQILDRLIKSPYMLRFIDDEVYRRRILVQLDRGESRHEFARLRLDRMTS